MTTNNLRNEGETSILKIVAEADGTNTATGDYLYNVMQFAIRAKPGGRIGRAGRFSSNAHSDDKGRCRHPTQQIFTQPMRWYLPVSSCFCFFIPPVGVFSGFSSTASSPSGFPPGHAKSVALQPAALSSWPLFPAVAADLNNAAAFNHSQDDFFL